MLSDETLTSRLLDIVAGTLIFLIIVAGSTYYLQSSLVIYKNYDAYTHWAVILIGIPLLAGLALRQAKLIYPLITTVCGAIASALMLYPFYKDFWAEPPTLVDLVIYVLVVLGIAFIATQPIRTTFMIAFRIGRFSVPTFSIRNNKGQNKSKTKSKKKVRKTSMTKTQRLQMNEHGSIIALLELIIGLTSLALSIFSIFFLGRG